MTTSRKAGTPKRGSKKLNLKKKTLKDLEPRSGRDARGGTVIRSPYTTGCQPINTSDCRTKGACAPTPVPPKIG
jgi:hypothetical protein